MLMLLRQTSEQSLKYREHISQFVRKFTTHGFLFKQGSSTCGNSNVSEKKVPLSAPRGLESNKRLALGCCSVIMPHYRVLSETIIFVSYYINKV